MQTPRVDVHVIIITHNILIVLIPNANVKVTKKNVDKFLE